MSGDAYLGDGPVSLLGPPNREDHEDRASDFFSGGSSRRETFLDRSLTTDGGNKLLNRTLFRFHAPSRGCYVIQATSLQTGFLTVELNLRDVSANSTFQTRFDQVP